jgi:CRP/FNR family transcriptional regulator, cyclic AMP receptor protein
MTKLDKTEAVARSYVGADLDAAECAALAEKMGVLDMTAGMSLVHEGEGRRTLFLLADGKLSVCKADHNGESEAHLYQLHIGECANTRAFLDGSERRGLLRADTDGAVLTLEPEDFESLIESQPWLVYKFMRALFRVTHTNLMRMNLESAELRNYMMKTGGRY